MFGHNYFGPGNKIYNKKNPIDSDDIIALKHDWYYEAAQNEEDIQQADEEAVDDFIQDFQENHNFHSLVGGLSLFGKKQLESVLGVQYPAHMHPGQQAYANRMKQLSNSYRAHKRTNPDARWNDFVKQSKTERPTTSRPTTSSTSPDPMDYDFANFDLDAFDIPIMDTNSAQDIATTAGPMLGGGPGRGSGGHASLIPNIQIRPDSIEGNQDRIYRKHRTMFSWGYAMIDIIADPTAATNITQTTTPFALVPVDFLPFYLTPQEYYELPAGTYVKSVHCKVKWVGPQTSFDIGSTLTGNANSEHVMKVYSAIGLNLNITGRNNTFETSATNPMLPTKIGPLPVDKYVDRFYKDAANTASGVPRALPGYFVIENNDSSNSSTNYPKNKHGRVHLNKYIRQHYASRFETLELVDYSYKPHYAPLHIKDWNTHIGYGIDYLEGGHHFECLRTNDLGIKPGPEVALLENDKVPNRIMKQYAVGGMKYAYPTTLEKIGYNLYKGTPLNNRAQPQVHIGISGIPQLNPTTNDYQKFSTTAGYFDIECTMVVGYAIGSHMLENEAFANYKECSMNLNGIKYVDGHTLFGWNDNNVGGITESKPEKKNIVYPVTVRDKAINILEDIDDDDDNTSIKTCSSSKSNSTIYKKLKNVNIK